MNGFHDKHTLDPDAFADSGPSTLRTFDAFPKTKPTYKSATESGGKWTVCITLLCALLTLSELRTWWAGTESHHFSVEQGVGHELQLNLDIVVAMKCTDIHVNVQDAAMDRILAGDLLTREDTNYQAWAQRASSSKGHYTSNSAGQNFDSFAADPDLNTKRKQAQEEDTHVSHALSHMRESRSRSKKKFAKAPKLKRGEPINACRIYGSLEGNKVQGDFHITARGHGYLEPGGHKHLDHSTFNFSHHINELSFGPHYPNLLNPLDKTSDSTEKNFYKFQYYLSIVPTIFTKRRVSTKSGALDPAAIPQPATLDMTPEDLKRVKKGEIPSHIVNPNAGRDSKSIFTNQYAATSQSREVPHQVIPGIFFKYDIEPILLIVSAQRSGFWALLVRLVNVISGIVVGGGWCFQLTEWGGEVVRRRRRGVSEGVLHGRMGSGDYKDVKFG
ncbi:hypothetical protein PMZ80_003658 [Knufia obscura]|uniref:Endoplasmic reticulum-Golgi intermediate compartment protein n=2 Tax=Knufia TaxID=430999 RepID=A0AAN8I968_9EURO|nr:hypothetical protein PMZ80_003658 [Knufia obscura]KAK5958429.1 hypothetical protein OHC33_000272 [Knufia fluminis]